jgi:hypothetical protein
MLSHRQDGEFFPICDKDEQNQKKMRFRTRSPIKKQPAQQNLFPIGSTNMDRIGKLVFGRTSQAPPNSFPPWYVRIGPGPDGTPPRTQKLDEKLVNFCHHIFRQHQEGVEVGIVVAGEIACPRVLFCSLASMPPLSLDSILMLGKGFAGPVLRRRGGMLQRLMHTNARQQ